MKTLIIIPSRLAATRLPNKPLLKINGLSIVSHVYKKAVATNIGDVFVATGDQEIIDDVKKNGGKAILTGNHHKTGTDRIYEALKKLEEPGVDLVLNLQGDEPLINIEDIKNLHQKMITTNSKFGTLGANILDKSLYEKNSLVKVITKKNLDINQFPEATNFTRKINSNFEKTYQHLGVYCYQKETLEKFISFKQSQNEIKNKLEQLRALDNNIKINVALAKEAPIGVDTEEDFVAIKKIMDYKT